MVPIFAGACKMASQWCYLYPTQFPQKNPLLIISLPYVNQLYFCFSLSGFDDYPLFWSSVNTNHAFLDQLEANDVEEIEVSNFSLNLKSRNFLR